MWTDRAALISIFLLSSTVFGCGQRAGGQSGDQAESQASAGTPADSATCKPLETRQPNAPDQRPAFPGQTRICGVKSNVAFDVAVLAKGLENPWAVEPLLGGDLLVTEQPGRMRIVTAAGNVGQPISGIPPVAASGQGGLLDVALSPSFESDRTIFWSYSEPRKGGNATSVARGMLAPDRRSLEQVKVIFRAMPTFDGTHHFGSRLAFGRQIIERQPRGFGEHSPRRIPGCGARRHARRRYAPELWAVPPRTSIQQQSTLNQPSSLNFS